MVRLLTLRLLWLLAGMVCSLASFASQAEVASAPQQHPHIEVQLVSEFSGWQLGQSYWVGLAMRPEQHWHTYWKNPGDSGLPTKFSFTSNEAAVTFGAIAWPTPERIVISQITNFGYYHDSLLMVPVTLPQIVSQQTLDEGLRIHLAASWLVCKESCIPGNAELELVMPISQGGTAQPTAFAPLFAKTRTLLPQADSSVRVNFATSASDTNSVRFQLTGLDVSKAQVDLFAAEESFLAAAEIPTWQQGTSNNGQIWWQADIATSDYFYQLPQQTELLLRIDEQGHTRSVQIQANQAQLLSLSMSAMNTPADANQSLLVLAAMAFVGGILLNLMPCVFPVLSLKALSLVKLSGKQSSQARRQGVLYAIGILLSLFAIGLLLTGLKQAGNAVGWGFQLQDPWFLAVLTLVMVAMAASLMGAFEIAGSWMAVGSERLSRGDDTASFLSGCLAVVVASPCMTPLMAPALGVALTLPFASMLLVLMALGLGLAMPILLLTMWPALISKMPKPGPWLETFKQALAFPLLVTAIWLLWLLQQHDPNWVLAILLVILVLAFCGWLKKRQHPRLALTTLVLIIAIPSMWYLQPASEQVALADRAQPYSPEHLQTLLADGNPVFINMTADWCLTCKVNERVTFRDEAVGQTFEQLGVTYMVGDWTHRDAEISRYLDQFQHAGVPLYVLYDQQGKPQVLPQLLTPSNTIKYLRSALDN